MDRPLELISISDEGDKFVLKEDTLALLVQALHDINADRCSVVSVVGAFRCGKSFLLDLFLRYLYYTDKVSREGNDEGTTDNDELPAWVIDGGDKILEGNASIEEGERKPGFLWRGGKERMTTGIWVYGRPFAKRDPVSGELVGVLLMDTQGMFDLQTTRELTASIFGLSTLISSFQIYNVSKQIQEDKLEQLDYFTQFSIVALKEFEKSQERTRENKLKNSGGIQPEDAVDSMFPFQRVDFLVRDWQNFTDDEDIGACLDEMSQVLEHAMDGHRSQGNDTRDQIRRAFETIGCFLLPHPGLAMTKANYDGSIRKLEKSFLMLMDVYVKRVFEEGVSTKRVQGREITPKQLGRYIQAYARVFEDGKMPQTMTLVEAIASTNNLCARDDAISLYKQEMLKVCGGTGGIPEKELADSSARTSDAAFKLFDEQATFGAEKQILDMRKQLEDTLRDLYEQMRRENQYKLQAGLVKYVIPVIAAVAALVIDVISDWTCDSWSQKCVDISRYLSFFYYLVFLVLFYEFYRIYRTKGSLNAGMGALALGKASLEKVDEWKGTIQRSFSSEALLSLTRAASGDSVAATKPKTQ